MQTLTKVEHFEKWCSSTSAEVSAQPRAYDSHNTQAVIQTVGIEFLRWSNSAKSRSNQGLNLFLILIFFMGACL
jgi:hypothetical protein